MYLDSAPFLAFYPKPFILSNDSFKRLVDTVWLPMVYRQPFAWWTIVAYI